MTMFDVLTYVYDIITLPIYAAFNLSIKEDAPPEIIRTGNDWKRKNPPPQTMIDDVRTIQELTSKIFTKYGDQTMLGVRPILTKEVVTMPQTGKQIPVKDMSSVYKYTTFNEVQREGHNLMKGFLSLGIKPKDRVVIFMETRREWAMSTFALFGMNTTICTIYATLGDQGVISGVNQTGPTHLITSNELMPKLANLLPQMKTLKHVIVVTDVVDGQQEEICIKQVQNGVTIHRFDQLVAIGSTKKEEYVAPTAKPEDIAVIMFTSGSTGDPKGVVISHEIFVNGVRNLMCYNLQSSLKQGDSYLTYLPMAHILELISVYCCFCMGFIIHYGTPTTLIKGAPGLKEGCPSDFEVAQPIALIAVPLMVDRIRKAIEANGKKVLGSLFDKMIEYKKKWNLQGQRTPLIDKVLLSKARALFGGKLKYMMCGGAALSEDTQIFCRDVFGISMSMGWGATETCSSGVIMAPHGRFIGRVGGPGDGVTIRLRDWAEEGYTLQDKPFPRGEVLVNAKCVAVGYYNNPELTDESFITDEQGNRWWVSGDIFEAYPDGTFRVVDRKKDLVKLQFGEYISLGKCEAELKGCPMVDNLCIVADALHNYIIALIMPNLVELQKLAKSLGKDTSKLTFPEMCKDPDIETASLNMVIKAGKRSGLMAFELPKKIKLVSEQWSPDGNGLVTAALKIRRKQVAIFYSEMIETMWSN